MFAVILNILLGKTIAAVLNQMILITL